MTHFEEAAGLHEPATEEPIDGTTFENIANTNGYLDNNAKAKQAYRRALEIYTRTEGKESDNAQNFAQLISELDKQR